MKNKNLYFDTQKNPQNCYKEKSCILCTYAEAVLYNLLTKTNETITLYKLRQYGLFSGITYTFLYNYQCQEWLGTHSHNAVLKITNRSNYQSFSELSVTQY